MNCESGNLFCKREEAAASVAMPSFAIEVLYHEGVEMKLFRQCLVCALAIAVASGVWAQAYPSKPVRIIVPSSAGSGTDVGMRLLAEGLLRPTGQSFVVDNRPGGAGNIGMAAAAKSPADGYTLVTGGLGLTVVNQFLYTTAQMGFDPVKDLEPILLVAKVPYLIAANSSLPASNVQELIAAAKAKPGTLNVALTTTSSRMVYELLTRTAGAPLFPVTYKTTGSAVTDTIGGQTQIVMETIAALRSYLTSAGGRLKPIAVTSRATSELLPNVKSVAEQGVADFEIAGYVSLYGPKGMPREAVNYINAEINKLLLLPETRKRFIDLGLEPGGGTPQDLADLEIAERRKWGPIIKAANITAE